MKNSTMLTLVTGASRGIGYAIAEAMASKGSNLFLVARNKKRLKAAAQCFSQRYGVAATAFSADLALEKNVDAVADECIKRGFIPNLLVLNAGIFLEGTLTDSRPEDYRKTLDVNLHSIYYFVRRIVPYMKKCRNPRIVLIASTAGYEPYPVGALYGVAKWALRGYGVNLRKELMTEGIGVTLLCPGGTLTDLWAGEKLPPNRLLVPADIGKLVAALTELSPQAVVEEIIVRPMLGDMHD